MDDFAPDNLLSPEDEHRYPLKLFFVELFKVLIIGAFAVVAIRYFVFKPFVVKGTSMEPNFHEKEYLIIDELSYHFKEPQRGEIVVVRTYTDDREYFLKRVIGLPGERIEITNGRVKVFNTEHIDGAYINETNYLNPSVLTTGDINVKLGPNEFYVLGDNRPASLDSRRIGPIQRGDVVGRVLLRGWPLDRLDYLLKNYYPQPFNP